MFWLRYNTIDATAPIDEVDPKVPDYLHDLNAMHEAEEILNENKRLIYSRALVENFHGLGWQFDVIHATSAQRAEAFLRTIGKWKD